MPSGILLLIRQGQWVSVHSILALIGPEEFLYEGDLMIQIHRTPYRREISFEDVYLKKLFSLITTEKFRRKESSELSSFFFSPEPFQRIQTGDFSRFLLKAAESLRVSQNFTHPFSFPWEKGDVVGNFISLVKIEVRKPIVCLSFTKVKREFNWNTIFKTNNISEFKEYWKYIFQICRFSLQQNRYLLFSSEKTYRNFFNPTQKIFLKVFYIRFSINYREKKFI